jgi:hypothetical protein
MELRGKPLGASRVGFRACFVTGVSEGTRNLLQLKWAESDISQNCLYEGIDLLPTFLSIWP